MAIIGLVLLFAGIIAWQVPSLVHQRLWGELAAFAGLMLLAMVYAFGLTLGFTMPNPTRAIGDAVTAISNMLF